MSGHWAGPCVCCRDKRQVRAAHLAPTPPPNPSSSPRPILSTGRRFSRILVHISEHRPKGRQIVQQPRLVGVREDGGLCPSGNIGTSSAFRQDKTLRRKSPAAVIGPLSPSAAQGRPWVMSVTGPTNLLAKDISPSHLIPIHTPYHSLGFLTDRFTHHGIWYEVVC
jgi:hypothetical protein